MLFVIALIYVCIILIMIMEKEGLESNSISIIAHRGASGYAPENTMIAFQKAIDQNADIIEMDVQMTKDGELVVFHDSTVDRTTNGTGYVKDFLLEDLKQLDAGSWFHPSFSGERIPTLNEVLSRYGNKVRFLIELKDPHLYPGIERKLASVLKKMGVQNKDSLIVQSFDLPSIRQFHHLLPNIATGLLVTTELTYEELDNVAFVQYINPNFIITNRQFIERLQNKGFGSFIWTINSMESLLLVKDYSIEGIITDYPDLLYSAIHRESLETKDSHFLQLIRELFQEIYKLIINMVR